YSNINMAVPFPPGEVVQNISIPIVDDNIVNADRYFTALLSNPQPVGGPALGNQTTAKVTIINDDSAISFSAPTYSINEDTTIGGANIQILRAGTTNGTATVTFMTTTNGTAVPGVNYTPVSNTVVFVPGQTSATMQVPVIHDPSVSGDKTVGLLLT